MPKKLKQKKPLSKEEVTKYKPIDQAAQLQEVMGFGLQSAFDLGVKEGAVVAKQVNPKNKLADVDDLPTTKKKTKSKKK